ncbi:hypothetical protein V5D56_18080 [Cellulosimicrobium sp. PMB13]|uniref:hypothetical protein n=1 Tax=Cellulosimicrobium sp. PMB13 TaxID=3120158 RepID=UPI003F4BDE4A
MTDNTVRGTGGRRSPVPYLMLLVAGLVGALWTPPAVAEPGPEAPDGTVTWGVRPAETAEGVERPTLRLEVEPGSTADDAVVVSNYSAEPLGLALYPADVRTGQDGTPAAALAADEPEGAAAWVTLDAATVTVDPGASATVPFRVAVPADAEPGDHTFALLTAWKDDQGGLSVDRRLGTVVDVRVAGPVRPTLAVEDLQVRADEALSPASTRGVTLRYTLVNSGNVRVRAQASVELRDLLGRDVGGSPPTTTTAAHEEGVELLPGDRVRVTTSIEDVAAPALHLRARLTVAPVVVDREPPSPDPVPAIATAGTVVVPWAALAALLLLAGVLWAVRRRRRRAARWEARIAAEVERRARLGAATREPEPVGTPPGG